jgi:hypothetical protein
VEPNEQFAVRLSAPTGAVITTASAIGTILNDDTIATTSALSASPRFLLGVGTGSATDAAATRPQLALTVGSGLLPLSPAQVPGPLDLLPQTFAPVLPDGSESPLAQTPGGPDQLFATGHGGASGAVILQSDGGWTRDTAEIYV